MDDRDLSWAWMMGTGLAFVAWAAQAAVVLVACDGIESMTSRNALFGVGACSTASVVFVLVPARRAWVHGCRGGTRAITGLLLAAMSLFSAGALMIAALLALLGMLPANFMSPPWH